MRYPRQRDEESEPFECPEPVTCQFPRCSCGPDDACEPDAHPKNIEPPCPECGVDASRLLEVIHQMLAALKLAHKLPMPWIYSSVESMGRTMTEEEWSAITPAIDEAIKAGEGVIAKAARAPAPEGE